jgi:hypothetical protein
MGKTFFQKAYEKIEMVKRNPGDVSVMMAKDTDGQYQLVIMAGGCPVARILGEVEIDSMEPLFDKSEILNEIYDVAAKMDGRKDPDDFQDYDNYGIGEYMEAQLKERKIELDS